MLTFAAFTILALIEAVCIAGLVQQGLGYRYEQRLVRAARIQELEREMGMEW